MSGMTSPPTIRIHRQGPLLEFGYKISAPSGFVVRLVAGFVWHVR